MDWHNPTYPKRIYLKDGYEQKYGTEVVEDDMHHFVKPGWILWTHHYGIWL